ncbi:MAG TPA: type I restriction enzyme HsdR N-terminal domain-containing protein [Chitinophagaceae bacterium]|nr:type I restriction enzyme HsdR N-terminal domain-containing protein [Chitinophagaceae bacterium]
MIQVAFPEPSFRLKRQDGREYIFDSIRRRWLQLTEEEWVRQNFINYLVQVLGYPASLIAVEKGIRVGELSKRFDILVYDRHHRPWMLVECKRPGQDLAEEVLLQALRYHLSVPACLVVITNGSRTMGWEKTGSVLRPLDRLPAWSETGPGPE